MLKQRTTRKLASRSLPQRKEQLNNSFHRIYVSPRLIKQVGFDTKAILFDAQVSGREFFHWIYKSFENLNGILRRHIFGFFLLSLSIIQLLPAANIEMPNDSPAGKQSMVYTFNESIETKKAPIFQRPVRGLLSQSYWYFHPAIDIPNPYGTEVKPIAEGLVTFAGWDGGYGYSIIIKHKSGFSSRYAHLSRIFVKKGAKVNKKTTIGLTGSTGYATGSHLHLEIYDDGDVVDPQKYLPKQ